MWEPPSIISVTTTLFIPKKTKTCCKISHYSLTEQTRQCFWIILFQLSKQHETECTQTVNIQFCSYIVSYYSVSVEKWVNPFPFSLCMKSVSHRVKARGKKHFFFQTLYIVLNPMCCYSASDFFNLYSQNVIFPLHSRNYGFNICSTSTMFPLTFVSWFGFSLWFSVRNTNSDLFDWSKTLHS